MPTSAAGSKAAPIEQARRPRLSPGFTLIELMVVVALIAIATAGASLALRDSADSALERDAQRLAAMLESTRAQARASDAPAMAQVGAQGFVISGLPQPASTHLWLSPQTVVTASAPIELGPEPLIAPRQIALRSSTRPDAPALWVVTDGLRPFSVQRLPGTAQP